MPNPDQHREHDGDGDERFWVHGVWRVRLSQDLMGQVKSDDRGVCLTAYGLTAPEPFKVV